MRGRIMEKMCKTCKYCQGDSQCYGQKNAPRVNANDCCERWRARMTNGDKLLSVFEGATIYGTYKEKGIIKVCVDNSYINPFDLDWWNSEYTESEEEE